jgi:hypothetical protein
MTKRMNMLKQTTIANGNLRQRTPKEEKCGTKNLQEQILGAEPDATRCTPWHEDEYKRSGF